MNLDVPPLDSGDNDFQQRFARSIADRIPGFFYFFDNLSASGPKLIVFAATLPDKHEKSS